MEKDYQMLVENKKKHLGLTSSRFHSTKMSKKAEEDTERAKRKHRSDIKVSHWGRLGYYRDPWCSNMLNNPPVGQLQVSYADYKDTSVEDFVEKYEKLNIPVIIRGGTDDWDAKKYWTFQNLYNEYKESKVKVGEDDDGYKLKVRFKYFLEYLLFNKDDSPLYMFESSIENHKHLRDVIKDYSVPKYFTEDLFKIVGEHRRPPYRWFLVGPERSGTSIHIDPIGTSAWNASLVGHKLWLLLPPSTPREIAKGKAVMRKDEDDEAIMYMRDIFPRIKERYGDDLVKEMWFLQKPGDIVFVPGGWWHVVVNLDDTIAITQNYCNSVNFEYVWTRFRKERKKLSVKFLKKASKYNTKIFTFANFLNERDKFVMWDEHQLLNKKRSKDDENKKSTNNSSSSSSSSYSSDSD